jgi:DNA-binding transcriptional ArsR family regulator
MANDAFAALAHPIRREIVERLSEGPASVGEVTRDFGVSKPTISRHLKMLEEAGVVARVIDGRNHRLTLRPDTLAQMSEWIDRQRTRWEAVIAATVVTRAARGPAGTSRSATPSRD